jgi:hypothetical protein
MVVGSMGTMPFHNKSGGPLVSLFEGEKYGLANIMTMQLFAAHRASRPCAAVPMVAVNSLDIV